MVGEADVSFVVLEGDGASEVPHGGEGSVEAGDGVVAEGQGPGGVGDARAFDAGGGGGGGR